MHSPLLVESSLAQEGPLLVSKWIKLPLLIDQEEMSSLWKEIEHCYPECYLYQVHAPCPWGEGVCSAETFLSTYAQYIACLQQGNVPSEDVFKQAFSKVISITPEALYAIRLGEERGLIKARQPIVQMQPNYIRYSPEDGEFRTQVYSSDSISWGILFGYPHLYQNPHTHEISSVQTFPNTLLFRTIQQWVREWTRPTPFNVKGRISKEPIRLGKNCFSWIHRHPQLISNGICIG